MSTSKVSSIKENSAAPVIEKSEWFRTDLGLEVYAKFTENNMLESVALNFDAVSGPDRRGKGIDAVKVEKLIKEIDFITIKLSSWCKEINVK